MRRTRAEVPRQHAHTMGEPINIKVKTLDSSVHEFTVASNVSTSNHKIKKKNAYLRLDASVGTKGQDCRKDKCASRATTNYF